MDCEGSCLPTYVLKKNDLVVMEIVQGLEHDHLNIIQEMELELLQPHHVGSDAMKFPLLLSLYIDYAILAYQIIERFWIA